MLARQDQLTRVVSTTATATAAVGYDRAKLENGVLEPLRELGVIEEGEEWSLLSRQAFLSPMCPRLQDPSNSVHRAEG